MGSLFGLPRAVLSPVCLFPRPSRPSMANAIPIFLTRPNQIDAPAQRRDSKSEPLSLAVPNEHASAANVRRAFGYLRNRRPVCSRGRGGSGAKIFREIVDF